MEQLLAKMASNHLQIFTELTVQEVWYNQAEVPQVVHKN